MTKRDRDRQRAEDAADDAAATDEQPAPAGAVATVEARPLAFDFELPPSTCGNCRAFLRNEQEPDRGACRRFPPVPLLTGMQQDRFGRPVPLVTGYHSPTLAAFWCSEWAPSIAGDFATTGVKQ